MRRLLPIALLIPVLSAQTAFSRRAPGFSLPDMQLKQHDIADYRGKIVLLDFMRTACPSCQALTGVLEELQKKYGSKIAVLSVVTPPENQTTVGRYMKELGVTSPVLFDCGQMTSSYLRATPQNPTIHLPRLMIVDENGFIRLDFEPGKNDAEMNTASLSRSIDGLLKK